VLPVSLSNPFCLFHCRTLDAVLAVPAMPPIEEDQMGLRRAVGRFVDTKKSLDGGALPALLLRVELLHAKLSDRRLRVRQLRFGAST